MSITSTGIRGGLRKSMNGDLLPERRCECGAWLTRIPCVTKDLGIGCPQGPSAPQSYPQAVRKICGLRGRSWGVAGADLRIPDANHVPARFRVDWWGNGSPKGLTRGSVWTKGDLRGHGPKKVGEGDLSTEWCRVVDLSPGREGALWITSVDKENKQVAPMAGPSPSGGTAVSPSGRTAVSLAVGL